MINYLKKITIFVMAGVIFAFSGTVFAKNKWFTDFTSYEAVLESGYSLNEDIADEGFVLLKNDNDSLPLNKGANISAFGKNTVNPVYGGSGSGSGSSANRVDFYQGLRNSGLRVNEILESFYRNNNASGPGRPNYPGMFTSVLPGFATGETPVDMYTPGVKSSYKAYGDAAVIMISRIAGEGYDLPVNSRKEWGKNEPIEGVAVGKHENHYLQLTEAEEKMINMVATEFNNVVLIINSSNAMELGFIDELPIDSAIWIGGPGSNGFNALGRILTGEVNPSGKLVDIYAKDFKKDPTWFNFAKNTENTPGNAYFVGDKQENYFTVDYEEGIYLGYRYYETRAVEEEDENWYEENVVYPFGYGLSYTNFEWTIKGNGETRTLVENDKVEIEVTIKNTGEVAGKEVVQLYYTAPYTEGGVEKSHVVLADFGKTKLLKPGHSQTLTLTLDARDMASYDYKGLTGSKGYVLESGDYGIKVMKNSHEVMGEITYNLPVEVRFDKALNGNDIKNRFDDVSFDKIDDKSDTKQGESISDRTMSRADFEGTFPKRSTIEDRTVPQEFIDALNGQNVDNKGLWDKDQKWLSNVMPKYQDKQLTKEEIKFTLYDLIGKDYDHEDWDKFLDQFTIDQYANVIGNATYALGGHASLVDLGIPRTANLDGPSGLSSGVNFVAQIVVAATWNKELAYRMGTHIGNEALWTNAGGWYAPGVNIHRSPFSGRNFEYYSEDPVLSGMIANETTKGATDKGVIVYIKHFALNDQETDRTSNGILTWANEQTMREIYLKAFELPIVEGKTRGVMSAFNRIGTTWAGASYELLTEILRDEWGFEGVVVTDMFMGGYMKPDLMIRAGNDLTLGNAKPVIVKVPENLKDLPLEEQNYYTTQVHHMRKSAKNALFGLAWSLGMQNGYENIHQDFDLGKVNAGRSLNIDLAKDIKGFEKADTIKYRLADGGVLPEGLSITVDGRLTGTPLAGNENVGKYTFVLDIIIDEYVTRKATYEIELVGGTYNKDRIISAVIGEELVINLIPELSSTGEELITGTRYTGFVPAGWFNPEWNGHVPSWLEFGTMNNNHTTDPELKGIPTEKGRYEFEVRIVTNFGTFDVPFIVDVVEAGNLSFVGQELGSFVINSDINLEVKASGSNDTTYALKSGSVLPEGLTLNSNGEITGKTSKVGTHKFIIVATANGFVQAEANFEIVIKDYQEMTYVTQDLSNAIVGTNYVANVGFASESGVEYTLKSGSKLPEGLTLGKNGVISGTTKDEGETTFIVVASKDGFKDVEVSFTINSNAAQVQEKPSNALAVTSIIISSIAIVAAVGVGIVFFKKK